MGLATSPVRAKRWSQLLRPATIAPKAVQAAEVSTPRLSAARPTNSPKTFRKQEIAKATPRPARQPSPRKPAVLSFQSQEISYEGNCCTSPSHNHRRPHRRQSWPKPASIVDCACIRQQCDLHDFAAKYAERALQARTYSNAGVCWLLTRYSNQG